MLAIRGFILFALLVASVARAELQIEINQGVGESHAHCGGAICLARGRLAT